MISLTDCQLILGDCLEKLKEIPNNSATLIFADPPYNLIGLDGFIDLESYKSWCDNWFTESLRILNNQGTLILCGRPPILNHLCVALGKKHAVFREWITWYKVDSITPSRDKHSNNYECFAVFSKWMDRKFRFISVKSKTNKYSAERNIGSIWEHCKISSNHKEGTKHPTQKPIKFLDRFVDTYTDKGDLVIDPFMGSGTTGVACANLGREFIGIEIDKVYFKLAEKRIKEAQEQQKIFSFCKERRDNSVVESGRNNPVSGSIPDPPNKKSDD